MNEKLITFAVPCYNSESYMDRCLETLLSAGRDIEILVVDDGSQDGTGALADKYEAENHGVVRAIHQPNKGHGGAVNTGIANATGRYFKVVDSDDWLDTAALETALSSIRRWESERRAPDLVICNYVYDHLYEGKSHTMRYANLFPEGLECSWDSMGRFLPSQYLLMHALIYKTSVLRASGLVLPLHTFYVDNVYAYQPLPLVGTIRYLDIDLYHYFIGREDQSVNQKVMMSRIDQQIRVTKIVASCVDLNTVKSERLVTYMTRSVSIMLTISCVYLMMIGTADAQHKREELWDYMSTVDKALYGKLKRRTLSALTRLPGKVGHHVTVAGYRAAKKIYRFQ